LITGLAERSNVLTARGPDGAGASITITSHPIGGPVFAGFQVQPWICSTVANGFGPPLDAQCNVPTKYEFFYRSTSSNSLQAYNPGNPPSDVSTTTTDQGRTVPFIVRRETGVLDRGWYSIAVLFDPTQPLEPWTPPAGWNSQISWTFGGSSTSDHYQRNPPDVLNAERLGAGFMVAASSLNTHGQNNNDVVSSETVMMLKERIIDQYGEIRYVIGDGCSGGSILQHMLANAYPGLIDGIQPSCSYADPWGPIGQQLGRGFGRNPYSNEGVQYGLHALISGEILPEQFVDLNEKIGGRDIDYNWIPQRTSGDRTASAIAYGTGRVND